ncbi:MAG: hypothetical protein LBV12_02920, partial [Puniceicoccales bacterium]|nr:hypothetical protein [Puniceicoccales bacterium]
MNHHHRISDEARAEREARVLAVVLGMASTDETAAVEQLLRDDPELRAYRDELIETLPTLQEALKASADSPDLRMDEARRAVLLRKLSGMEIKPWVETMPGDGNRMSKSALKEASTNIVPWPVFFRKNIGTIAACAACAVVGVFVAGPAFWPAPEITVLKSRIPEEAVTFTFGSGGGQGSLTPPENGMHYDRYSSTLGEARISDIAQSGKPSSSADASSLGMTSSGIGVGRGGGRSSGDFSEKQGKAQDGAPFSVEGGVIDSLTPNMRARSVPATSAPQPPRPTAPSAIVARKPSGDSGVSFADKQRESVEAERDSELSAKKKSFSTSGYSGTTKPATGKIVAEPNSSVSSGTDLSHEAASMRRAAQIVRRDSANGRSINAGTKLESTVAFSAPAQSPAVAYRGASVERQDVSKEAVMASGEKMVDLKITSAPRNLAGTIGAAALVSDESVTEYFHRNPLRADVGDLEPLAKDEKREADFDLSGNLVKDKGSIDYGTMPRSTASGQTINGGMISGAGEISKMGEGRLLFADSSFEGKPVSEKDTTTPVDSGTRYLSVTSGKLDQLSIVGDVVEEGRLSTKGRREGIKTESSLSGKGVPSVGGKAGGNGKMSGSDGFSPIGGSFSKERSSPESLKEDIWDHDPVVESDPVSGRLRAVIPAVTFRDAPLSRVVETLSELSKMYDPEQKGVNMVLIDPEHLNPNISVTMRNVSIDRLLEYVTKSVSFDYMI